jgi:hypothetical protein
MSGVDWIGPLGTSVHYILFYGALLVGMGVVIEYADQIRWQLRTSNSPGKIG